MGTKLTELRDGCFARALDDEPMFVLLARDASAPILVRTWAEQRRHDIERGRRLASDMAQVLEAEQSADRMEAWRRDNDGAWRTGLFNADPHVIAIAEAAAAEQVGEPHDIQTHHVMQQGDEYACSCGVRWDVREGEDHP